MLKSTTGLELALVIGETHPLSTMSEVLHQAGIFVKRGGQFGELLYSDKSGEKTFHMTMNQALEKCMAVLDTLSHQKGLTCHHCNCVEEARGEILIVAEAWRKKSPAPWNEKSRHGRSSKPAGSGAPLTGWYICSEDGEVNTWEEERQQQVPIRGFKEKFAPTVAF